MTALEHRILEISYKHKLSHIGSCLGIIGILDEIYSKRQPDDPVILSCGHAGLALYVILEKYLGKDAEELFFRHGVHPNKNSADGIYCSTGSLGQGITVAVGRALADRKRNVWCIFSDGEEAEGSTIEALRFAGENYLTNFKVYRHYNAFGAYREINRSVLHGLTYCNWMQERGDRPEVFCIPFLTGQSAHYCTMSEADWKWVQEQPIS